MPGPTVAVTEPAERAEVQANGRVPDAGNAPEETNVWPDEAAEAAFLGEAKARGEIAPPVPRGEPEEPAPAPPPLDELVNRIPAPARELLDELFRARFTVVRRIRKSDLKP